MLAAVPVLCGALAAVLLLRHPTPRRTEYWKCSIWVWTWLLLATIPTGGGFEIIMLFPYLFYYHLVSIALAAVGVEFDKFAVDLRQGRTRLLWVNPTWYLSVVGLLAVLLLGVVMILVHRQT